MKKLSLVLSAVFFAAAFLSGETVTLPAAASLVGGNPFFSDVRVFNTSYTSSLDVAATYRCFIPTVVASCPATAPQLHITLAPRESRAFDDMVAGAFGAHDTAGGVEFEFSGSEDQLVVTSRLFSSFPFDSVGMFIPGLRSSKAHTTTVLGSIRHDPGTTPPSGFRTNVGVFNTGDSSAVATLLVFDFDGEAIGTPVVRTVPGHSGAQVSGIFEEAGLGGLSTANATIRVSSDVPLLSYAAVLDNRTADPIFVVGAPDQGSQSVTLTPTGTGPTPTRTPTVQGVTATKTPTMGGPSPTPTLTRTPTPLGPTNTPTQPGPTSTSTPTVPAPTATPTATRTATSTPTITPTPSGTIHDVTIGPGFVFNPSTVNIAAGDSVRWTWAAGPHSTTSGPCPGGVCMADGNWNSGTHSAGFIFTQAFPTSGTFPYHCQVHLAMMQGSVVVAP